MAVELWPEWCFAVSARMRRPSWHSSFWIFTTVAILASCSADINPQPEPPNYNGDTGGASYAAGATGGGYALASGGYMSAGGAGFAGNAGHAGGAVGTGGAPSQNSGGASSVADADVVCPSDAAAGALQDASVGGCMPPDKVGN